MSLLNKANLWPAIWIRTLRRDAGVVARAIQGLRPRTFSDGTRRRSDQLPAIGSKEIAIVDELGTTHRFYNFWLRDHCQCSSCVHPDTKQRLLNTFALPRDIQAEFVSPVENGLQVRWADDGHESVYTWDWLERHGPKSNVSQETPLRRRFWGNEIKHSPPSVRYSDVMRDDEGVQEWTRKIHEYGMCYVDDCPVYPKATQELLERIAQIRHTHYGGFWDFTSDLASKDTAYTSLALSAHTDTTYFSDPAGLQLFHLLSHIEGSGGVSLLVDGFRAAMELKKRAPEAYHVLSRFQVPSHASGNDGLSIRPFAPFPVLNHDPVTGELVQVRWNNDDRDVLPHGDKYRDLEKWYDAAQQWVQLLRSEEAEFWDQLRPGRPLIFDNWRVLHGRSAFTGKRRMCGGYIDRDYFMSRYRMTNRIEE